MVNKSRTSGARDGEDKMEYFSMRNGFSNAGANNLRKTSNTLKERIWTCFYKQEFDYYDTMEYENYTTGIEDMMIEMGVQYDFPENRIIKNKNAERLYKYVVKSEIWFRIYDFIEKYLNIKDEEIAKKMTKEFNRILEEEVTPYRVLDRMIVPIVNEEELKTLGQTTNSNYDSVSIHILKALELYSDRQKPDYENSVKESISAVEAMCNTITGMDGANATLGNAIKKLKKEGIYIHPAMENAFKQLYGYTSDSSGIRHGGIEFINVPSEDAKYMLVSCSAFVNYLMEKWIKVKET